jgi:hypothetical protein
MTMILVVASGAALICQPAAARAEMPEPLPDLHITPENIVFQAGGRDVSFITLELDYLNIGVYIVNAGPAVSRSANVSFSDNGRWLGVIPVNGNITATEPDNWAYAEFTWNLGYVEAGNHTIRVSTIDARGDANLADNAAEVNITVHGRAPVVAVKFDTANRNAKVTATSPGSVTFSGSLVLDFQNGPVDVTLHASTRAGWPCSLNVSTLSIADYHEHPFSVTVTVPAATLNSNYTTLEVEARATADGVSTMGHSQAIIAVEPYFCLTIAAKDSGVSASPGQAARFDLTLTNTGNAVDSFCITVTNLIELREEGWTVDLGDAAINKVSPGSNRTFTVTLSPIEDWVPYKNDVIHVRLNVGSLNSKDFGAEVNATVLLTVEQKGFFMPSVGVNSLIILLAVLVSGTVAYSLRRRKRKKTAADYDRELNL